MRTMAKLWMKIWVWTKIVVFGVLTLYVLVFIIKNSNYDATVWFGPGKEAKTTSLLLAIFAFLGGVLATVLLRTTLSTIRQFNAMKERNRREKMEREFE